MENANSTRKKGMEAEIAVAEELEKRGFVIVERNYFSRFGEIDIVAKSGDLLIFVEVKCRKPENIGKFGTPAEAVTLNKQRKIIKTAQLYLSKKGQSDSRTRFDVAEVYGLGGEIRIIEGAFDLTSARFQEGNY